jgi:hypothetical protein
MIAEQYEHQGGVDFICHGGGLQNESEQLGPRRRMSRLSTTCWVASNAREPQAIRRAVSTEACMLRLRYEKWDWQAEQLRYGILMNARPGNCIL